MKRAKATDIKTKMGNRTFRATGVTAYSTNHGTLELAIADAESFFTAHNEAP
jgi:hypothetical protein